MALALLLLLFPALGWAGTTPVVVTNNAGAVHISSQDATTKMLMVDKFGHLSSSQSVHPTLGTCTNGALADMAQTDTLGSVVFSGANSSCAVVFAQPFKRSPIYFCNGDKDGATVNGCAVTTHTTTGLTMEPIVANWAAGEDIEWFCIAVGQ